MRHSNAPAATSTRNRKKDVAPNAIDLLEQDHKQVKTLFRRYDKLAKAGASGGDRRVVSVQICTMLKLHALIEEEIFYPAARDVIPEPGLIDEAAVEHATAKDLIAQIESMDPDAPLYDAKLKVLAEYIDHHVKEEEGELFPKIRRRMDLLEVGQRLQARKEALVREADPAPQ